MVVNCRISPSYCSRNSTVASAKQPSRQHGRTDSQLTNSVVELGSGRVADVRVKHPTWKTRQKHWFYSRWCAKTLFVRTLVGHVCSFTFLRVVFKKIDSSLCPLGTSDWNYDRFCWNVAVFNVSKTCYDVQQIWIILKGLWSLVHALRRIVVLTLVLCCIYHT